MGLDKGAVALILGFGFIILLSTFKKPATAAPRIVHKLSGLPSVMPLTPEIGKLDEYKGKAFRVHIENWGIPRGATVADIIRFERTELDNVYEVSDALLAELDRYNYSDAIWVCPEREDAAEYLSEGMAEKDISEITIPPGSKIITDDGGGGYLVLLKQH